MTDSKSRVDSQLHKYDVNEETQQFVAAGDVVRVLDDYLEKLKVGKAPSREELLAQHPELAAQLDACLAGLNFLHGAQSSAIPQQQIGDFRIVREVGRGGMGAVFEAVQVSLGRRVALKILRFSSVSDKDAIDRFQREAETVATLHHTNIVPIFYVGSEKGVNYYAMQFIDGRDLAQLIADRDSPISSAQVVSLGLQAAEALAHAHRRGVIHRDVKPSNLILDKEDRLWLTDFGLARRADDVSLSLSGMLLGTPRYMSPEHAQASTKRIDHRSDLFSLGATLYELITRKPAFPGDFAPDVIQHILIDEPTPIRKLNPSVPRDLETVVMKCMAKDPNARYESAEMLAGDLRAVLEDRPIEARRANIFEQSARWLKQNRRSVSQISTAAMVTLAVTLTSLLGWSSYRSWNMSSLQLDALQAPLVAEILNDTGKSVRTETLPMQTAANLPAGEYKVRVSSEGTLSQDFDVSLVRGSRDAKYTANVTDQWSMTPQPLEHSFDVVDLGNERAIAVWGKEGITVHKHQGPQVAWSLKLSPETAMPLADSPGYTNPRNFSGIQEKAFCEANESRPWMIQDFIDVNDDGVGDLVCAARHQAWLMAISGNGEGVLWFAGRAKELGSKDNSQTYMAPHSSVLYSPTVCDDLDNDGLRDFVVTIADPGTNVGSMAMNSVACELWIEAISSRTGKSLWRHDLAKENFLLPGNQPAPYDLRWFGNMNGGHSMQGGGVGALFSNRVRSPSYFTQTGPSIYTPSSAKLMTLPGSSESILAMVTGDKLLLLNLRSGALCEPAIELGFRPGCEVQWADVDGDQMLDMVALEETNVQPTTTGPPGLSIVPRLVVWSLASRQPLWSKTLNTYWPRKPVLGIPAPKWPLVCDLDSDGKSEVIVPDESTYPNGFYNGTSSSSAPTGKIAVFGTTNSAKWTQKIVNIDGTIDHFVDGPDLDSDGTREVFAVSCDARTNLLRVDAISGATGAVLWGGSQEITCNPSSECFQILAIKWWHSGKNGWPQLLVTISNGRLGLGTNSVFDVVAFSAGTGQVTAVTKDLTEAYPFDYDKDGVEDLIVCSNKMIQPGSQGSFHCVRGMVQQSWKRMSRLGKPAVDLDRDGVRDFVDNWGDGTLVASSGATGREIWRTRPVRTTSQLEFAVTEGSCSGDLNGDGTEDLIIYETNLSGQQKTPLHLVSGSNGKLLWSLTDVTCKSIQSTLSAQFMDLSNDMVPEVVWIAAMDYGYPSRPFVMSTEDSQLWMCVASGRTGELMWAQPLSPTYGTALGSLKPAASFRTASLELAAADLNGDKVRDFVVPAICSDGSLETRALSGRDGTLLWKRARQECGQQQQALENYTSASFCDFEGDGQPEVILVEPVDTSVMPLEVSVVALDKEGRELWAKSTGSHYANFREFNTRGGQCLRPIFVQAPSETLFVSGRTSRIVLQLFFADRIVTFDKAGNRMDCAVEFTTANALGVFAYDIDYDGQEELFFMQRSTLNAVRADKLDQVIWQKKMGDMPLNAIRELIPKSADFPPLIVLQTDPTQNRLLGINAETGEEVWTCAGPIQRTTDLTIYSSPKDVVLLGGKASEPPLVCFQYEAIGDCRQAYLSKPMKDAGDKWLRFVSSGTSRSQAVTSGIKDDPRWKRPLPWRISVATNINSDGYVAWGVFFSLTLLICPVGYACLLIARRRFQLSYLLLLPVIASIFVQAVLMAGPYDNEFSSFTGRLGIAIFFAPVIISLMLFTWWGLSRRWYRILAWLSALAIASLAVAAISLIDSVRSMPLTPEESFDWQGWYLIVIPVGYFVSWFMMFATLAELLVRRWWRRFQTQTFVRQSPDLGRLSLDTSGVATIAHPVHESKGS